MTPSESSLHGRTHAAVAIELTFEQAGRPRRMAARPSRVEHCAASAAQWIGCVFLLGPCTRITH
jgi:hypothetical protein